MDPHEFSSFEEFWPFYVKEHAKKSTRRVHFAGTSLAMACLAGGLLTKKRWLLAMAPVAGYGAAWVSHFFIEGNRPATFKHPLWSLQGDFVMWWKMVRGEMDAEVERVMAQEQVRVAADASPAREEPAGAAPVGEAEDDEEPVTTSMRDRTAN